MTLRGRLAVAFTAILLAPMALGAAALAGMSAGTELLARPSSVDDESARAAVRSVVVARCQQLTATAAGLAATAGPAGGSWAVVPPGATGPWAICGVDPAETRGLVPTGLAARAEIRAPTGEVTGYAYAVQPLDQALLDELSAAANRRVSLAAGGSGYAADGATPGGAVVPPEPYGLIEPDARAPLALRLDPAPPSQDPVPLLLVAAAVAVIASALVGAWLADVSTRPLRRLLATAERASSGDLSARAAVDGRDETGRLGRRLDELIVALQDVQRLSLTDALTGLGNRRHLTEALRLEIERANRFGRSLGVLALDLDHFKSINDRHGHRVGDAVLVEFAARIRRVIREVDSGFRQGGEEFVVLLPETDVPGSLTAAHRLGEAIRHAPFPVNGHTVNEGIAVTVSVGIAVFPRHARTAADLLDAADQALYAAKAAGRDTFVLAGQPSTTDAIGVRHHSAGDVTARL